MPIPLLPDTLKAWEQVVSSWDAWLLTFVLVAVVPVLGYLRFRRLTHGGRVVSQHAKLIAYARTICLQWALVAVLVLVLKHHGLSAADVGERIGDTGLTFWTTAAVLAIAAGVAPFVRLRVRRSPPERLARSVGRLRSFAPAFGTEMVVFMVVCLTAGTCEELLYRGWLINVLGLATGSAWFGVAFSAAVFGIGHAYQGGKGMLRAGFIGLQLALLFVFVGSLIPGQALHAAADLVAGFASATAVSRLNAADSARVVEHEPTTGRPGES
jgi:membrane protease YdiL (CAAX protease family)